MWFLAGLFMLLGGIFVGVWSLALMHSYGMMILAAFMVVAGALILTPDEVLRKN